MIYLKSTFCAAVFRIALPHYKFKLITKIMKKTLLSLAAALLLIGGANAQTEQGKIMAGGSLGVSFGNTYNEYDGTKGAEYKNSTFSLTPKVGYFFIDGLAAGLEVNLDLQTQKIDEDGMDYKGTSSTFLVGPFARYYSSVGLFGDASIGFGSSKFKEEETGQEDGESKSNLFGWSLGAGYAIFLNDNVSIEPMISYNKFTFTDGDDSKDKNKQGQFLIEVGFNIFL